MLAAACWLRLNAQGDLITVVTWFGERFSKTRDLFEPLRLHQTLKITREWLQVGALPALLGVGAVWALMRSRLRLPDWTPPRPELSLPLLAALLCLVARHWLWTQPLVSDEISYVRQAQYYSQGQWGLHPPAPAAAFLGFNFFERQAQGTLHSVYPPGWPWLLALAMVMRVDPWIQALLAGVTVYAIMRLAGQMFGRETARTAGALALAAPALPMLAATYFSQTLSAALLLLCLSTFLEATRRERFWPWSLACGLTLGWLGLTRYADGALASLFLLGYLVWLKPDRVGPRALPALVGLACGAALLGLHNLETTGSLWKLSFTQQDYDYAPHWASAAGHTFLALLGGYRLDIWQTPGLFALAALAGLSGPHRRLIGLVGISYLAYYSLPAQIEIGSRYLYPAACLLTILAADGLHRRLAEPSRQICLAVIVALSLASWVCLGSACRHFESASRHLANWLDQVLPAGRLVFVRSAPEQITASLMPLNSVHFQGQVYPLFLDEASNQGLRELYRNLPAFVLDFNFSSGSYELHNWDDPRDPILDRLMGAINWAQGGFHYTEAIRMLEPLRLPPDHPRYFELQDVLGRLYLRSRQPAKALALFESSCRLQPTFPRLLNLIRAEQRTRGQASAATVERCRSLANPQQRLELQELLANPGTL